MARKTFAELHAEISARYVRTVQREEIRRGISAVRHQHEVGSDLGDTFNEMVSGERALKAGGHANTMNQFAAE